MTDSDRLRAIIAAQKEIAASAEELARSAEKVALELEAAVVDLSARSAAKDATSRDGLTGLGRRAAYHERLGADVSLARRHGHPLSLCLLDVHALDEIVGRHGRAMGDESLRRVARALTDLREGDQAFRVGDHRFALVLSHTTLGGARALAIRLRDRLQRAFPNAPGLSVSTGVVELDGEGLTELHAAAEASLAAVLDTRRATVAS
jgi:diguanylate cyclase (GGDEF)-like protein